MPQAGLSRIRKGNPLVPVEVLRVPPFNFQANGALLRPGDGTSASNESFMLAMSRDALIDLPPSDLNVATSDACARLASPSLERPFRMVTLLADEKLGVVGAVLSWIGARRRR